MLSDVAHGGMGGGINLMLGHWEHVLLEYEETL